MLAFPWDFERGRHALAILIVSTRFSFTIKDTSGSWYLCFLWNLFGSPAAGLHPGPLLPAYRLP